jgi:hypothetical protein
MYQDTWALQQNASYAQQALLHEAEVSRLARHAHGSDEEKPFSFHHFQRRLVAVAVALVTVLGVVALT